MTPFASRLIKDVVLNRGAPERSRSAVRALLDDVHCFEVSAVSHLAKELAGDLWKPAGKILDLRDMLFLPAPKTWIETTGGFAEGVTTALHLEQKAEGDLIKVTAAEMRGGAETSMIVPMGYLNLETLKVAGVRGHDLFAAEVDGRQELRARAYSRFIFGCLALINTPRIIGRRQRMPQYALEKKLTRGLGVGKFPLHAWHEIKLEVAKPIEVDDGEPHEAHLTGRRALHFCRAHLRIRLGQLEYVTSHWRGDPALGIKQTRYRVVA